MKKCFIQNEGFINKHIGNSLPTVATWQCNTFWHFILSVHMFHSLKCHWELGCTFIKRVCHSRTTFAILYVISSLSEAGGRDPDSETVKAGRKHTGISSRNCGPVPHSTSQGKCWRAVTWSCGSILISGVYLPKFLGSFTWTVLSLSPLFLQSKEFLLSPLRTHWLLGLIFH